MKDNEKDKIEMVELKLDGFNFQELKRECWEVINMWSSLTKSTPIPNIVKLGELFEKHLQTLDPTQLAIAVGRENKLAFIKEIRRRTNLDLRRTKQMADGIWEQLGW
jgi:hypothetical protein